MSYFKKTFFVLATIIFLSKALLVSASGIFILNDKSSVYENDTFVSTVYINTSGKIINSSDGTITFPKDKLQALSVSTYDSVFNLWVEQPVLSNTSGTVSFSGGIPNPGYNGVQGKVLQVTFKALKVGSPSISFSSAALRLNDGLGTDVSDTETGSVITIKSRGEIIPAPENTTPVNVPVDTSNQSRLEAPIVTSVTMPNSEDWYGSKEATLEWKLPKGALMTEILLGSHPDSSPIVRYSPAISSKKLTNLENGIWYLHVRLSNSAGLGKIAHRKIKIDLTSPSKLDVTTTINEGISVVDVSSDDALSGIANIELFVDGKSFKKQENTGDKAFSTSIKLDGITQGKHIVLVKASDKAGNKLEKELEVEVTSTNPVNPPSITEYPKTINLEDSINIKGTTSDVYNKLKITLIDNEGNTSDFKINPLPNGTFEFTSDSIKAVGNISVFAETILSDDTLGSKSNTVYIEVKQSNLLPIIKQTIEWLSIIIPIIALIALLIIIIHSTVLKIRRMRAVTDMRISATQRKSTMLLGAIYNNIVRSLARLQEAQRKRNLTETESEVMEHLKQSVELIEKDIPKSKR